MIVRPRRGRGGIFVSDGPVRSTSVRLGQSGLRVAWSSSAVASATLLAYSMTS
jgi:hypothetical protein